ncbi:MAG: response regulator transcription factor [Ginsengibacter sp.]
MKRIILADDHSFVRLGLIQILKDEYPAVEIFEVSNGEDLVKQITFNDYDLLISDLDMPGKSGLEALEEVRIIKPEMPVLILSIYPEELYAVRVLKAGASGYMNKNAAPEELINAVQRILLGRKYITPEIGERLLIHLDSHKKPHQHLTNREFEIFKLLALGKTITNISRQLSLALTTVSTHRSRIMKKLDASTNSELTRYAIAHHIIKDIDL